MSSLTLFLFGPPYLEYNGQLLEIDARKTMALLAYLAVQGGNQSRDTLLTLLWPDLEPRKAQNVLRRNLSMLNKALGGQWLVVERDIISLDEGADAWVDVVRFRRLAQSYQSHDHPPSETCADCLQSLAEAVSLYRADFLAGFGIRNSPNFDDWQGLESENLKRKLTGVLQHLVEVHSQQQAYDQALVYAQQWLNLAPLHEPLHRRLMELYAAKGDRSAALHQYQQCVQCLEAEFGVPPETATIELFEQLRQNTAQHRKVVAETYALIDGDTDQGLARNLLGSGGMGNVYRGVNAQTGEPVAIKVLKPEIVATNQDIVERFVREGQALRQLNHPNIVKMLAASEQQGQHYLVMEYVEGGSLQELLARDGPLPSKRVLEVALDLADALTRAHRLNIIHRDLKPANILLAKDGTPRLTDFGVARLIDSSQLTEQGLVLGTINYLSPEGCEGQPLDERADIWSFGIILYEMLTGQLPFLSETVANTIAAILMQPIPDLTHNQPDTPKPLIDLIAQMLQKDPATRIASVRLVGAELEAILAGRPVTPSDITPVIGPPPPCPYRGLAAFQEQDAPFFFGREGFVRQLNDLVQKQALVAVVGSSGSGKSSVVFAGLVAQLRPQPNWIIASFRPDNDPLQNLAATLLPFLEPDLSETDRLVEMRKLAQRLAVGEILLVDVIDRILQKHEKPCRLLLVADQFEELYSLCPESAIRHRFLDILLDLIELQPFQPNPTFTFVLTLRADFLEQALWTVPEDESHIWKEKD